jgi:hypothetical protein
MVFLLQKANIYLSFLQAFPCLPNMCPNMGLGVQTFGAVVTEKAVGRHLVRLDHVGPQLCLGHLLVVKKIRYNFKF